MAQVLSGKIPAAQDAEIIIERPDASRITAIANIVPLKNTAGKITGAINCFYDISARKQTESALVQAREQLAQHARQLEGLVAKRTAELTVTNRRLHSSLISVGKGQRQNRLLLDESEAMQQKLRVLTHQIIAAQEEERKAISRELHDEVVQLLVGVNVELSALAKGSTTTVGVMRRKIAHTQRLVEESVSTVHRFARQLRPAVLDDLGLIPALHAYSKNLADQKKIKINLTAFGGVESLGMAERTVLFRVAQESLNNVVRHAHASLVTISITKIPGAIQMDVSDNGKAFNIKNTLLAKNNKRLGLIGMKERIEMVGGKLTLASAPGRGTTVRTEIPFTPQNKKHALPR
jgi:signal transduction histidine kinase